MAQNKAMNHGTRGKSGFKRVMNLEHLKKDESLPSLHISKTGISLNSFPLRHTLAGPPPSNTTDQKLL